MWTRLSLCLMLMTMIYPILLIKISTTSAETKQSDQKRLSTAFFRLYGINPNHRLTNRRYYDDDVDKGAILHEKRQFKKKSPKASHQHSSPYTIAFPSLIRTRRWIQQEY